jgi:hypothetical protein
MRKDIVESSYLQRELEPSSADGTQNIRFSIKSATATQRKEEEYIPESDPRPHTRNIPTSALAALKDRNRIRRSEEEQDRHAIGG